MSLLHCIPHGSRRRVKKEMSGSMQLLRIRNLFTFFAVSINYCVVVATYSILVYLYAKIEYVSVRTYPSENRIRSLRCVSSSVAVPVILT